MHARLLKAGYIKDMNLMSRIFFKPDRPFRASAWAVTVLFLSAFPALAQTVSVTSNDVSVVVNTTYFDATFGTAPTYTLPDAELSYEYPNPYETSHVVFNIDGVVYDMESGTVGSPMVAVGTGEGAYIQGSRIYNNVECSARYEIVRNVLDNSVPDFFEITFCMKNNDSVSHQVAVRYELDTMVNGNDGTNISIDNGNSVILTNSLWRAADGNVPPCFWDYDVDPHNGTPNLVGRGVWSGNPYGDPVTPPDAVEVNHWTDVNGIAQWAPGITDALDGDSAVVMWWTGSGNETSINQPLNPGAQQCWTFDYGLNRGILLTPTPPAPTPTFTATPTPTITLTATPTSSPTITPTTTPTGTPTITPTHTPTPTPTCAPNVWPNPYDPHRSVNGTFKAGCLPPGATVGIYTLTGELVNKVPESNHFAVWDGKNQNGNPVSSGVYYYVIQKGDTVIKTGKLIVVNSS